MRNTVRPAIIFYYTFHMETIKIFVENLIALTGVSGDMVHLLRHALLVIVAVCLAWLSWYVCRKALIPAVIKLTNRTPNKVDDVLFSEKVLRAACSIVPAIVVWQLLPWVFYQYPIAQEVLSRLTAIYINIAVIRLCLALLDSLSRIETKAGKGYYLRTICGVLKIIVIFIGVIVIAAIIINKSPMTLFAGLGATSAVLMLVFKDTIEGLAAGIRLTSNDMLHRGDWITVPSTGVDGEVEDISLTVVKVRNFDNTIMTISPITLVNGTFQNWKGMLDGGGRRVKRKFFIDFKSIRRVQPVEQDGLETNMAKYRSAIEQYLSTNQYVNRSMTYMVRQLEATQCGLPIELYFFLKEKSSKLYEHQLAEIMEYVYALAPEFGLKLYQQYPEQ